MTTAKRKRPATRRKSRRKWSHKVKTESTFPPPGLFTKDAETVARAMASKKVSPRGIGSGIRMVQLFINRAGKNLSATRKRELERARRLLQARQRREQKPKKPA